MKDTMAQKRAPSPTLVALLCATVSASSVSCGVKGPPLPPVAATPEGSDTGLRPAPSPSSAAPARQQKRAAPKRTQPEGDES